MDSKTIIKIISYALLCVSPVSGVSWIRFPVKINHFERHKILPAFTYMPVGLFVCLLRSSLIYILILCY